MIDEFDRITVRASPLFPTSTQAYWIRFPMNPLSLNLIAVSVFTMTLATLLSPLLHIPPAWPGMATVAVLGLATLDAFTWEGRGGTIVLDCLARLSPRHRDRVICHEAGHFVVAAQLGIPVTDYCLSAWEAFRKGWHGQGGIQLDTSAWERQLHAHPHCDQVLDRLCTVWMAGIAAEYLEYGHAAGGQDDRRALQQILTQRGLSPQLILQKQKWAQLQAQQLLQSQQPTYAALVQQLQQRAPVPQCYQRIQRLSNPTEPA
jgi:hypothetical protein